MNYNLSTQRLRQGTFKSIIYHELKIITLSFEDRVD